MGWDRIDTQFSASAQRGPKQAMQMQSADFLTEAQRQFNGENIILLINGA